MVKVTPSKFTRKSKSWMRCKGPKQGRKKGFNLGYGIEKETERGNKSLNFESNQNVKR